MCSNCLLADTTLANTNTGELACGAQAALSGGRETGTAEQLVANEDPAQAFNPVVQLESILKAPGSTSAFAEEGSTERGGGEDRRGAGFVRQAVADLLPG